MKMVYEKEWLLYVKLSMHSLKCNVELIRLDCIVDLFTNNKSTILSANKFEVKTTSK